MFLARYKWLIVISMIVSLKIDNLPLAVHPYLLAVMFTMVSTAKLSRESDSTEKGTDELSIATKQKEGQ